MTTQKPTERKSGGKADSKKNVAKKASSVEKAPSLGAESKSSARKASGIRTKKSSAKKTSAPKAGLLPTDTLVKWVAYCTECDWRGRPKGSEEEAFEDGVRKHGNPKNHAIDTERY